MDMASSPANASDMDTAILSQTASEPTDAQAQVRARLEEIWPTAAARDFDRLESFHLYGPKFTSSRTASREAMPRRAPPVSGRSSAGSSIRSRT